MSRSRGRKRRFYPGMLVLIDRDCRDNPTASGQLAIYEGRFWLHNGRRYRGPKEHLLSVNPRFILKDGSRIWGCQCWWIPARESEKAQELLRTEQAQEMDAFVQELQDIAEAKEPV